MRHTMTWTILLCVTLIPASGCATGNWTHFGERMKFTVRDPVCTGAVVADKDKYAGKHVRVKGKVHSVCAHKGCWLRLGCPSTDETIFVKFTCPVEGRLIPMEAVGHRAIVEGTFEVTQIPEEEARHYKEDAGASPEEIAKIVGPQKQIRMASPAAKIEGLSDLTTSTQ